ncbi:MAG: aminomethyltransferase [Lysobacteraceae bacterium]|nr:MAG: aminomethyltransferase [Xanthomonadaceae bacterium]
MLQATVLNDLHRAMGAKMVDFGGWDMPIHYGSQIEEHHAVRRDAGMFDVSHMTVVDLSGGRCRDFLRYLLANDVDRLKGPGRALYTCMLNTAGGVIDDLIVYWLGEERYRLVVNAATREKDLAWMNTQAPPFAVDVRERADLAMIAVQGPQARERVGALLEPGEREKALALPRFAAAELGEIFLARTGYTGEDGFEICMPGALARDWWPRLAGAGVRPAGLGARDTLRLEAGMNLYGQDMDESTTPFEAGLGWTVAMQGERNFIGRPALEAQLAAGVPTQMIGVVMDEKGVLRHDQVVRCQAGQGRVLSGSFSPTCGKSIGLVRVPAGPLEGLRAEIRGRELPLRPVKPPFVRNGHPAEGM